MIARSLGIAASVVVTGTLFGLLHAAQLWGGWTQIGMLVVVGIIFTYVRAATRDSLCQLSAALELQFLSVSGVSGELALAADHAPRLLSGCHRIFRRRLK